MEWNHECCMPFSPQPQLSQAYLRLPFLQTQMWSDKLLNQDSRIQIALWLDLYSCPFFTIKTNRKISVAFLNLSLFSLLDLCWEMLPNRWCVTALLWQTSVHSSLKYWAHLCFVLEKEDSKPKKTHHTQELYSLALSPGTSCFAQCWTTW